mmetsp:Transcript_20820/g.31254  ORF Transcript_20820/g.31254 Transcript_20820/m.31254 type:complete len:278 (+) Transcript_20820:778-1611(+)
MLAHFTNHRITRKQTTNDMVQHIMKGIIPGSNHTQNPIGHILNIGRLMNHHRPHWPIRRLQPPLPIHIDTTYLLTGSHNLPQQSVDLGLTRVPRTNAANILLVRQNVFLNGAEDEPTLGKGCAGPGFLGVGCCLAEFVDVRCGHGGHGANVLECGWVVALDEVGGGGVFDVDAAGFGGGRGLVLVLDAVVGGFGAGHWDGVVDGWDGGEGELEEEGQVGSERGEDEGVDEVEGGEGEEGLCERGECCDCAEGGGRRLDQYCCCHFALELPQWWSGVK